MRISIVGITGVSFTLKISLVSSRLPWYSENQSKSLLYPPVHLDYCWHSHCPIPQWSLEVWYLSASILRLKKRNFCHWEQRNLRSVFLGSPFVLPRNSANILGKGALPLLSPSLSQAFSLALPGVLLKFEENHSPTFLVTFYDMHQSLLNKVTKATQGTWTISRKSTWLLKVVGNSPFHFGAMGWRIEKYKCGKKSRDTLYAIGFFGCKQFKLTLKTYTK